MVELAALIPNVNVSTLKQHYGLAPPLAALLPPCHFPLSAAQSGLRIPVVPGIFDRRSIGEYSEGVESNIYSDFRGALGQRQRFALHAEAHEPAASFALDRYRLDRALKGPMQLDLDVPRALYAQLAVVEQPAAVAIRRKRDAVVAAERPITGKARLSPRFTRPKNALNVLSTLRSTSWQQEKFASVRHPSARIAFNWFA